MLCLPVSRGSGSSGIGIRHTVDTDRFRGALKSTNTQTPTDSGTLYCTEATTLKGTK